MTAESQQITLLLQQWGEGKEKALDELMPLVYQELHSMARRYMFDQNSGHSLQTTELIHEAYLKLAGAKDKNWENRTHFFSVASTAMRHILVDYARTKNAKKRGGNPNRIKLNNEMLVSFERTEEIINLDQALEELFVLDDRKGRVVEMKFFGGMKLMEIAEILNVSRETVKRDWQFARTWLLRELTQKC